eukprot:TRINITY_DN74238_c0_g1_i1.p1 TRINITY_DN74238_c0_g1~~TRINITY_DN74238_c0_g1_i1.p1  ORF type:complete len:434 (+),score=174.98 TRINITY_DN74238_c0_g1_i1:82-1383(+)
MAHRVSRLVATVLLASRLLHAVRIGEDDANNPAAADDDKVKATSQSAEEDAGDDKGAGDAEQTDGDDDDGPDEGDEAKAQAKEAVVEKVKKGLKKMEEVGKADVAKGKDAKNAKAAGDACAAHGGKDKLVEWFKTNQDKLSKQPDGGADWPQGDGTKDAPSWGYLKEDCMKNRHRKVIAEMSSMHCGMILEVGGYLTPIIDFLEPPADGKGKGNEGGKVEKGMHPPPLYVNVDPSMTEPDMEARGGTCVIHLPITLADFMGDVTQSLRQTLNISVSRSPPTGPTCSVLMGLWTPQLYTEKDRDAVEGLFSLSIFGAIESPDDELKHFETGTKLAHAGGLATYQDDKVDCYEAMGKKVRQSTAVREMRYFALDAGGKGEGKGKIEGKEAEKKEEVQQEALAKVKAAAQQAQQQKQEDTGEGNEEDSGDKGEQQG